MERKLGFDRAVLDGKVLAEDENSIVFPAVIAREMVQPYPEGRAYKPADELEKAAWTADGRWVTTDKHPDTQLIMRRDDIKGKVENPRFVKDLVEPKTKRPMGRGIRADLRLYKRNIPQVLLDEIRSGSRKDVSIGFLYDEDKTPGVWEAEKYDFVQRNIFIDHVAAAVPLGRCPSPFCGIGIDAIGRRIGLDPWEETEDFIHIRVLDPEPFETCRLTDFEGKLPEGVRVKYCKYKDRDEWAVQAYLFDKGRFTLEEAKAWYAEHKGEGDVKKESDCFLTKIVEARGLDAVCRKLVKSFSVDAMVAAIEEESEEEFMEKCVAEGGSEEDCRAKWKEQLEAKEEKDMERRGPEVVEDTIEEVVRKSSEQNMRVRKLICEADGR